jgi:class 3 adenylate cyclase/DNA-binding winged helix-turn-helix (wHTH) protein/predicted ATPase
MQGLAAPGILSFANFRLDRRSGGLFRRGEDGAEVLIALGSRALDILTLLLDRSGDLVSKDEIISTVWQRAVVEDSNLTVHIAALRRALDKDRAQGSCIQTVTGRGYRFVTPVTRSAAGIASVTLGPHEHLGPPSQAGPKPSVLPADMRGPTPQLSSVSSAERRQLTVMFCDLVGMAELSLRLDLEDQRELLTAYHSTVAEIVAGFDGFASKPMGSGIQAYFGYPRAHEDEAERAVRAALGVIDALNVHEVKSVKLQPRIGIATGLVLVDGLLDEASAHKQTFVGETPNRAARLHALAEPGAIVIAASTRRLVGDLFEYRSLSNVEGVAPALAWQVLRPSLVPSRFDALRGSALTQLIGRDEEIASLLRRWERAKAGDGQVVLLCGEPGIGKSRIVAELMERLQAESHLRLRYFCSPYHQDSALYPFIDQLGRAAGFEPDDPPAAKLEKLADLLTEADSPDEDVAFLADLLSLPASQHHPLPSVNPQCKKERTLEALLHQIEGVARRRPALVVFEDAHWIDPTSRELLDFTVERASSLSVLLILTYRPEFQPPWIGQPQVTALTLNRLARRDRMALATQTAGGKALPAEIVHQIADRTDGVPLFVEELTKSILESGLLREAADRYVLDGSPPPLAIPTTLQDSLMARLDRLGEVRLVAQIGAAIGREFSYSLLHAVSLLPEDDLQAFLGRLAASELVFQRGVPPNSTYTFKHALVQDVAHGSLLRGARRQLHARIAEVLETNFSELMDTQPELFAQHYTEAGLTEKSVVSWGKAGHNSTARSAMAEAAAQFQKALDQLALLPDTPDRQRYELEFWGALGTALLAAKGFAAPETGHAYDRARALWEQLGSPSETLYLLFGESVYRMIRGELNLAERLDEDLLRLGCQRNDSGALILGCASSGRTLMSVGKFASSRSHLEQVGALYNPISHNALVQSAGMHPQVVSLGFLSLVLFCLGFSDQALTQCSAAIAEARRLAHPPSLALTLGCGNRLLSLVGDVAVLGEWAHELVAMATERGFPYWRAQGTIFAGWLKVKTGEVGEGMSLLRSGSIAFRATGAELWAPHHNALLAEAFGIAGEIGKAVTLLDDALQIVERTGERWLEAELNRKKGQLVLRQGHPVAAEALYRRALNIARKQGAKLWELRAVASLAWLWRDHGRCTEARDLITPVYDWFTEGFATPDLKDAKALIEELT